jgi:hypothetical protein
MNTLRRSPRIAMKAINKQLAELVPLHKRFDELFELSKGIKDPLVEEDLRGRLRKIFKTISAACWDIVQRYPDFEDYIFEQNAKYMKL